jgi:peptidoglycan/LPS O-acetylase OafA/YrhL
LPPQSPPSFSETWASVSLDLVRGLAAILVLVDHWRNLFFVQFHELGADRLFFAVPYTLTAAGHQAVVIFFVLSGFLIARTIRRAFNRGEWSWASYLIHRLVRLWIVLLPGLVLCFLWDKIGAALSTAPSLHFAIPPIHTMYDAARGDTVITFIGNLFFVQGVLVPAFGSDGPLWSLANEFWYYILFPLGLIAILPSSKPRARLITAALLVFLCAWLRTTLLPLFPIWLLGAALLGFPRPPLSTSVRWLAAGAYVPIIFLCTHLYGSLRIVSDYMLAGATTIFLWALLCASQSVPPDAVKVRFCRGLARFSYTLYVVHLPFLALIAALLVGDRHWQPTFLHIAVAIGILAATVGYACGMASLTEFHTDSARKWVEQRFGVATAGRARDG